jgi:uncharacterized LabA/DUF88 family protein
VIRVICYIDGFNLYHAIDNISRASAGEENYLKWLDLRALMQVFTDHAVHDLRAIKYFSAYASWKPASHERHQLYVAALRARGVDVILGRFKEKDIHCKSCQAMFKGHEEKESDVNLAVHLMNDAHRDRFDQAFIVSRDSDLSGPIRMVRNEFPQKKVKLIAPPRRMHSKELGALAHARASISDDHLELCLLPQQITDGDGKLICTRPPAYDPPA